MMAGLQRKGRPSAARVALYTPKFSRKPLTVAIIRNAGIANRFSRKGGTLSHHPLPFTALQLLHDSPALGLLPLGWVYHPAHLLPAPRLPALPNLFPSTPSLPSSTYQSPPPPKLFALDSNLHPAWGLASGSAGQNSAKF
jgi:hypothetical protein